MIQRQLLTEAVRASLEQSPVTVLLGPRQSGKTTLAREIAATMPSTFFDLELPSDRARLGEAELVLGSLRGLVVLDEIQLRPDLFSLLRPLADRAGPDTRYLLLGSASPSLVKGAAESLAGRASFIDLAGLSLEETGPESLRNLWVRGGFPRSFLASSEPLSLRWRDNFVRTFLERDLPQLGIRIPSENLLRFWTMLAHFHGQVWNAQELTRSLGGSDKTLRSYLDLLCGAFVARQLQPWHENLAKRQVKAPKVYIRDSGLLHSLLGIGSWHDLTAHPKFGASWEGFALEQVLNAAPTRQAYFWATHGGAELDLMLIAGGKRYGIEFKATVSPSMTKSLHIATADLGLHRSFIVHPGENRYPVAAETEAIPLPALLEILRSLPSGR